MMNQTKKGYKMLMWLFVIISVGIKMYFVLQTPGPYIYGDELLYKRRAHEIFFFQTYDSGTYPPMYSLLLSLGFWGNDNFYFWMKLINVILNSLLILGVWKLGRLFMDEKRTVLCVGILMLFPWQYMIVSCLISENFFITLLVIVCYYFMKNLKCSTMKSRFVLGVLFAVLHLTRHITLVLLPIFFIVWFVDKNEKNKWRICLEKERIAAAVQIILSYFSVYILYIVYMLYKGRTLLETLGFVVSAGIGSEQIKEYATLGSLLIMIALYVSYGVLSYSFMLPVCSFAIRRSVIEEEDTLRNRYAFLTFGLVFMSFVASIRHSWRNEYNYPEIFHILGRYVWPVGVLLLVLFMVFLSDYVKMKKKSRVCEYLVFAGLYVLSTLVLVTNSFFGLSDLFLSDFNVKDIYYLDKYKIYWLIIFLWILGGTVLIIKEKYIHRYLILCLLVTMGVGTVSVFFYDEFEQDGIYGEKLNEFHQQYGLDQYDFLINRTSAATLPWDLEFWTSESECPVVVEGMGTEYAGESKASTYYNKYYSKVENISLISGDILEQGIYKELDDKKGIVYCRINDKYIQEPLIKFESSEGEFAIYEYPLLLEGTNLEIITTYPQKIYYPADSDRLSDGDYAVSFQTNQKDTGCTIYVNDEYCISTHINEDGIAAFYLTREQLAGKQEVQISYKLYEECAESEMSEVVEIPVVSCVEILQSYPDVIDGVTGFNVQSDGESAMAIQTNLSNEEFDFYIDSQLIGKIIIDENGVGAITVPKESYIGKKEMVLHLEKIVEGRRLVSNEYIVACE